MPGKDDRDGTLPVTAEVGSEGGSFADPTVQVATFEGDVAREQGHDGRPRREEGADPASHGVVRYPSEPPPPTDATDGRRSARLNWRTGLASAAAGAAVALAVTRLRGRRQ